MVRKLTGHTAVLMAALAVAVGASAASAASGAHGGAALAGGGFHGGGFHGGGFHGAGFHGAGFHGGGFHGGGFHGAAGWRGSGWHGYGWRHYGWGWGCCGWGWGWGWGWPWGWGWGLGWYLPVLPYETVAPPMSGDGDARGSYFMAAPGSNPRAAPASHAELFAYPKAHQSEEQQARDREQCRQWAAKQTGSSPAASQSETEHPVGTEQRAAYLRAQAACLEGRNYSVR